MPVDTYYFDCSDAGPTDPNAKWTNDANAFNGNTADAATGQTSGISSADFLKGEGTNAPASGGNITQVRYRAFIGSSISTPSGSFTSYSSVSTPSGGWDWTKLGALETSFYRGNDGGGGLDVVLTITTNGGAETLVNAVHLSTGGGSGTEAPLVFKIELEVTSDAVPSGGRAVTNTRIVVSARNITTNRTIASGRSIAS